MYYKSRIKIPSLPFYITFVKSLILKWLMLVIFLVVAPAVFGDSREIPSDRNKIQLSFAPLVAKVAPAVVNIYTRTKVRQRQATPLFDDPFFRRFFNDFGLDFDRPRTRQHNSLGSGVIIEENGLLVTNKHVIEGADSIKVVLIDRREFDASVIFVDEKTDIAFLKINSNKNLFPYLKLKNSDDLKVGDLVLAIGNPFGVGQTVTSGIISGLARTIGGRAHYKSFIQTDAAINPGNSGGALVSIDGFLAGVNTAIYSKSGGSLGIGFAVPSNMIKALMKGIETGSFARPWFGVAVQTITADLANSMDMQQPVGVLVTAVHKSSEAFKEGIKVGDVVLSINSHKINNPQDLNYRIATIGVGEAVSVDILKKGKFKNIKMKVLLPPEIPLRNVKELKGRHPLAGASVANLSPAIALQNNLDPFLNGVVVINVQKRSHSAKFGFKKNDIIIGINRVKVFMVDDLINATKMRPEIWRVAITRNGRSHNLVVRNR